jgi:multicomponent K+:H+ antiporter subunit A
VVVVSWSWIPEFGLHFALRLDGLSFLFALLVLAIGLLVLIYSHGYLGADEPLGRFLGLMLGFMGGMLGIVLAENLLLLALFWEITSLSSFLLIGFHHREAAARRAALMALSITGAGGLALLGGVLLLGAAAGGFAVTDVLGAPERIAADPLRLPILLLIVLAAFTKSAQLPLHFWLPNAMVAPTPVSAYLHSAAMVKAGVYLLARLWPALSGLDL